MRYLMVVLLAGVTARTGSAQSYGPDPGDAPDHGVARISVISGDVTVRRGDSGEYVAADLNTPLVERDHVLTEDNGRTEIQFDWANLLRLAPDSEVRLSELRYRDFLVQIAAGTVTLRVRRGTDSQIELSTPTASFRPTDDGAYRITVRDDYSTEITVRAGEGEVFVGGSRDTLRRGQTLLVSGDPSDPRRAYRAAIPYDDWDRWNERRDDDLDRSDSYKYISRDIYGAEDLHHYGRWVYDPPYGWVWVPDVAYGWAPYRVGRWAWVDYYGWTWVSGDPWGWAPYHYGRWYHAPRYGWVWYPGVITVHYTWRPALVAFFGWGINLGWVPLAPYEVYRPWYGSGRTVFVNNVTVVNNINVINMYRNSRFIGGHSGVTSVVSRDFGRRSVSINNYIVGNDRDFARAGDAGRWLSGDPPRESRRFSDRTVTARAAARREVSRPFITRPDRQVRARAEDRNDGSNRTNGFDRERDSANRSRAEVRTEPRESRPPVASNTETVRRSSNARSREEPRVENRVEPRAESRESRPPSTFSSANARRADTQTDNGRSNRNETVTFPRSQPERQPSENSRRIDPARRNETEVIPRNEPPRSRAPETSRVNPPIAAAPSRREVETPRRIEPQRERAMASPEPPRVGGGPGRVQEAPRPQAPRSMGEGRPLGNPQSSQPPIARGGQGRSPVIQSAPAPAAPAEGRAPGGNGNGGGNGNPGGNGRGRGR